MLVLEFEGCNRTIHVTSSASIYSLATCDESGHTNFPFSFLVLSWGELWLICPELPQFFPELA